LAIAKNLVYRKRKAKSDKRKAKSEKRQAKSEKRKAINTIIWYTVSEKRKAKSDKRKAKSEKGKAKSEKRKAINRYTVLSYAPCLHRKHHGYPRHTVCYRQNQLNYLMKWRRFHQDPMALEQDKRVLNPTQDPVAICEEGNCRENIKGVHLLSALKNKLNFPDMEAAE
jgi:hypothetical protein